MTLPPTAVVLAALAVPAAALAEPGATSGISPREQLVIFDTAAARDAESGHWRIPLHAWVYVPQQSRTRKAGLAAIFRSRYGLEATSETAPLFDSRINLLLADNKHGRRIVIDVGGRTFVMPPTRRDGHTRAEITLPGSLADRAASGGVLPIRAILDPQDGRHISGRAMLIEPLGLSIISDIDDTVKVSNVTDRARLWESTFFKPWQAAPGMTGLYRGLATPGAALHYVSSSPWHLYQPLTEFLHDAGFPRATLALKKIRLKDRSILNILRSPAETKPPQIEEILARWPQRRFILVGDSGEKDPEVYAGIMRRHPGRIERTLIRNVTGETAGDARFTAAFAGIDRGRWQLFDDPSEVRIEP